MRIGILCSCKCGHWLMADDLTPITPERRALAAAILEVARIQVQSRHHSSARSIPAPSPAVVSQPAKPRHSA